MPDQTETPDPTETPDATAAAGVEAAQHPTLPSADSRNKAVIGHLSAFVTFVGIPSFLGPLVGWLVWRDTDPFAADQSKEALNFNLSFLLYGVVAAFSIILLVGFLLLPAVIVTWLVLTIVAAMAASKGETYRYPFTIRFVQ
jgi:uncharacterized Tic20 family protein